MRYRRDGARCVLQWGATQGTSAYWAAGQQAVQEKEAVPEKPVPPKLATYIAPPDWTHMPLDLSASTLATWHRWRSCDLGRKPSGTIPTSVVPHEPEILAVMLYMFMTTIPPTRQNSKEPLPTFCNT